MRRRTIAIGTSLLIMLTILATGWLCDALTLTYNKLGQTGIRLTGHPQAVVLIDVFLLWLPPGIAATVLFARGIRFWPAVFFGFLLLRVLQGDRGPHAITSPIAITMSTILIAWFLQSLPFNKNFRYQRDVLWLCLATFIGSLIPATLDTLVLKLEGINPVMIIPLWKVAWAEQTIGVLVTMPFLLSISRDTVTQLTKQPTVLIVFFAIYAIINFQVFSSTDSSGAGWPMIVIALVAYAAMRFGLLASSSAVMATSILAAWVTSKHRGPFHYASDEVVTLWVYMSVLVVVNLLVTALRASEIQAKTDLVESVEQYRTQSIALARAKDAADEANRAKSRFLANMSHEIRTPLTAILGHAELICEEPEIVSSPQSRLQTLQSILNAGRHLTTILGDILDLSKIEAHKLKIELIDLPLPTLLVESMEMVRAHAEAKGIALTANLETPIPDHIMGDPTRLRQILLNLLGNAVKFTHTGSVKLIVALSSNTNPARLRIDVEDTGLGIEIEKVDSIFDKFSQADTTVTREYGGTGLGLDISRRLAELMEGTVTLVSSQPGVGSRFRLDLPMTPSPGSIMITTLDEPDRPPTQPRARPATTLSGRVLIAEDSAEISRLVQFFLTKAGAMVDLADNGQVALDMLEAAEARSMPYDLFLTDMQMPLMDGYTLVAKLRSRGHTLPIIALTAASMAKDRRKCIDIGCNDYLTKPIDRNTLVRTCRAWIGVSAATKAYQQN